ncbi:hypothetical protein C2E23DRAFT_866065 [Lenzites betulinus]|nr:hypothetical protein C2E23DRAFT_866065 [Lenzites betulinus]
MPINHSTTETLVDTHGRIIGVLAGRPNDPTWDGVVKEANRAMKEARAACSFRRADMAHRRGSYATLARGVSFGGGQRAPRGLNNSANNEQALAALCNNPAIRRIAGFGNNMLATYAPKIYRNMNRELESIFQANHLLQRPFSNSMYPTTSFNFGPESLCVDHTDALNDPINWIHVAALGDFDPARGGHLVLSDLRLVIRFPPGSSILFPSAVLRHGNVAIGRGEQRMSLTQYCAGAS